MRPLYEHLIRLSHGPGKQHRARAIQQVIDTGTAMLYGQGAAQHPHATSPAQQVTAPAPAGAEHVDTFIDELDFSKRT
ncbi:MAG: hypothetical protein K2X64_11370 [Rhodocyclaceae bacterium]|nr:hypothetical protein [Rhodocyclaceae bacterium]